MTEQNLDKIKLRTILDHFGLYNQFEKLKEELAEALLECSRVDNRKSKIHNELADVKVMISQLDLYFNGEITRIAEKKIARTLKRIKSGYYNKGDK